LQFNKELIEFSIVQSISFKRDFFFSSFYFPKGIKRPRSLVVKKYEHKVMQSYPARALDRKLQVDWARDAREGPRVLMSLRVDFGPMG